LRDEEVISGARAAAGEIVADDPLLDRHPQLASAVKRLVAADQADYLEKS
jgi:ATP-dependent DNA helicase RecG